MKLYWRTLKALLIIIFIIFPFGQITKIPLGIPGVNLYLQDIIIGILVFLWLGGHLIKKKKFVKPPLSTLILSFIALAFISLITNVSRLSLREFIISFLYLIRWGVFAGIYFITYEIVFKLGKKQITFLKLLIASGTFVAFLGFFQYFLYPNLRNLSYLGWDPHYFRVFSLYFDPGFTGIILVLNLILIINLFWIWQKNHRVLLQLGLLMAGVLSYLALALTYSRSSYLAFIVGAAITFTLRKSLKSLILVLLIFTFTVFLLPRPGGEGVRLERKTSAIARLGNWQKAFKIIKDHPLLGVGFNTYRYAQRDYKFLEDDWQINHAGAGADSSLLFVTVTTGILGLFLYLWLWIRMLIIGISLSVRGNYLGLAVISSVFALLIHSIFLNSLFYPWVMLWIWFLLGISFTNFRD